MAYTPISNLPTPPSRQDPANFSGDADSFLGALPTFQTEVNAAGDYIDSKAAEVDVDATAAADSADTAQAAADSAFATVSATAWVSGASYAEGDAVWSLVNYQTYRAITAHSGETTDPSLDTTNWLALADFVKRSGDTMTGDLNVTGTVKSTVSTTGDKSFQALSTGGGAFSFYPDDATEANPTWVSQSNSSEDQAWVIGGVERMRLSSAGTLTANKFVGIGAIILVGNQSDSTDYSTTSGSYQTASRVQITPSSPTSRLIGWFYCQMRATSGQSDGDMGNVARVHYLDSSGSWTAISNVAQNLRTEIGTSTGLQEIAVTFPINLFSSHVNSSGDWDVAIRHYEDYDATSSIDDGRLYYMEYEP